MIGWKENQLSMRRAVLHMKWVTAIQHIIYVLIGVVLGILGTFLWQTL